MLKRCVWPVAHLDWSVLGIVHGLHCHKRSCGLAGFTPLSVLSGLEPVDAHEGCVACGSP